MPIADRKGRDGDPSEGGWAKPFGSLSVALAGLAVISAYAVGVRSATVVLAVLGLLMVVVGLIAGRRGCDRNDAAWLAVGGAFNGLALLIVLFRPGWLNPFWALNADPKEPGRNQMVAVPRKQPFATGKLLTANDWVDASTDAIRQGKIVIRIESVKPGTRGGAPCLQIHLQIANFEDEPLTIVGFGSDKPVLTDGSGRSYAFFRPQRRVYSEGPPIFEDVVDQRFELKVDFTHDYRLQFEMPPSVDVLKLEVPASAWGREGRCQFDLTGLLKTK